MEEKIPTINGPSNTTSMPNNAKKGLVFRLNFKISKNGKFNRNCIIYFTDRIVFSSCVSLYNSCSTTSFFATHQNGNYNSRQLARFYRLWS